MNTLLNKIDRALSFKGLFSLLLVLLMIPFPTAVSAARGGGGAHLKGNTRAVYDPDYDLPIVVSLGDSYSAGEGIEPFYEQDLDNKEKVKEADWLAHRSEKSWPGMLEIPGLDKKTAQYKDSNWIFVASSGAVTKDLEYEQVKEYSRGTFSQYSGTEYLPAQLDVFDQLEKNSVDYVTLTLGGNDANFSGIVTEAAVGSTYLNTSNLSDMLADVWKQYFESDGIRDDLYNSYKKIEKKAGAQAQIIVAGYPTLLDESGKGTLFSQEEAEEINRAVRNFNLELERLVEYCYAEDMSIYFVSVEKEFDGHEAYSSSPYINKVKLGSEPEELKNFVAASSYSIHPNYEGARRYASCVNAKIEKLDEEKEERLEEEALNPSDKGLEIVLVLDGSSSMNGEPLKETKSAAKKFVQTIFDNTEANVGIVTYNYAATIASGMTDSEEYLEKRIAEIGATGGTNIEEGLSMADGILSKSHADKRIIVLMSDGEPNNGKVGEDLIRYADKLKEKGYYIYTLGFFSAIGNKEAAYKLMEGIAGEGCHFEVDSAESLQLFFGDIADQISGTNYVYVRVDSPADVSVEYEGETLSSKGNQSSQRTSFGTMTFEESVAKVPEEEEETKKEETVEDEDGAVSGIGGVDLSTPEEKEENAEEEVDETDVYDNRVKVLRLKEGADYKLKIEGNGKGKLNYSIGFMNEDGEYKDIRTFSDIAMSWKTKIETVAARSAETYMFVDENGDGEFDVTYMAKEGEKAEVYEEETEKENEIPYLSLYFALAALLLLAITLTASLVTRHFAIKKYLPA